MDDGHDWKALVRAHARRTGAANLTTHAVDELAAHLEDMYLDARRDGRSDADAMRAVEAALVESPLALVPSQRARAPEARPHVSPPGRGWTGGFSGLAGDVRFAWRQLRRSPSFAASPSRRLALGAAPPLIFSIVDAVPLAAAAPRARPARRHLGDQC
jgi:hypothetical protein